MFCCVPDFLLSVGSICAARPVQQGGRILRHSKKIGAHWPLEPSSCVERLVLNIDEFYFLLLYIIAMSECLVNEKCSRIVNKIVIFLTYRTGRSVHISGACQKCPKYGNLYQRKGAASCRKRERTYANEEAFIFAAGKRRRTPERYEVGRSLSSPRSLRL